MACHQLHIASDTRHTPEVLILKVSAVAPAEYLQCDEVLTSLHILCEVEFSTELAILRVADKLAVHPHIHIRCSRADVEENISADPLLWDVKGAAVRAHVVLLNRHIGRVVAEVATPSVADVYIDWVAIAVQLPHTWHLQVAPALVVIACCEEIGWTLVGILNPVESPSAVERKTVWVVEVAICSCCLLGRAENLVRGVHWSSIDLIELGVTPLVEALCHKRSACHQSEEN